MKQHKYTMIDANGIRWRWEGLRKTSEIADQVIEEVLEEAKQKKLWKKLSKRITLKDHD